MHRQCWGGVERREEQPRVEGMIASAQGDTIVSYDNINGKGIFPNVLALVDSRATSYCSGQNRTGLNSPLRLPGPFPPPPR